MTESRTAFTLAFTPDEVVAMREIIAEQHRNRVGKCKADGYTEIDLQNDDYLTLYNGLLAKLNPIFDEADEARG